jgi:hypothetical protein
MLLAGGAASAVASQGAPHDQRTPAAGRVTGVAADTQEIGFAFAITNLSAGKVVLVNYGAGFQRDTDTKVQSTSGDFGTAQFEAAGFAVLAGHSTMSAIITDGIDVSSDPFTGTATIPAGASVTVTNTITQVTVTLSSGVPFSIPTGVPGLGAPPGGTTTVTCRGSTLLCIARLPIAGGASTGMIAVNLPGARMRLLLQRASSPRARWTLTGGHYEEGGLQYAATLDSAATNPSGSELILAFTRF